ncbi:hypothetical protein EV421DRAFT_2013889 [Armillaria borealis]|uniref:Uncharacterized protein n=1 Tax=Armillaria borealis TaxID=47425 RepID=A0AA39KBL9_9AGAR|nr:hypothetical protein EV421DRAFT_2013889 [Armillaria borealis]
MDSVVFDVGVCSDIRLAREDRNIWADIKGSRSKGGTCTEATSPDGQDGYPLRIMEVGVAAASDPNARLDISSRRRPHSWVRILGVAHQTAQAELTIVNAAFSFLCQPHGVDLNPSLEEMRLEKRWQNMGLNNLNRYGLKHFYWRSAPFQLEDDEAHSLRDPHRSTLRSGTVTGGDWHRRSWSRSFAMTTFPPELVEVIVYVAWHSEMPSYVRTTFTTTCPSSKEELGLLIEGFAEFLAGSALTKQVPLMADITVVDFQVFAPPVFPQEGQSS